MICAINNIKAQIITKNIKMSVQNITHWSQRKTTENFDNSFHSADSDTTKTFVKIQPFSAELIQKCQNLLLSSIDFNGWCCVLHAAQNIFAAQSMIPFSPLR